MDDAQHPRHLLPVDSDVEGGEARSRAEQSIRRRGWAPALGIALVVLAGVVIFAGQQRQGAGRGSPAELSGLEGFSDEASQQAANKRLEDTLENVFGSKSGTSQEGTLVTANFAETEAQLCTDGMIFDIQVAVEYSSTALGEVSIMTSSTGAFNFSIETEAATDKPVARFDMRTFSHGDWTVESLEMERDTPYLVRVEKRANHLCIRACSTLECEVQPRCQYHEDGDEFFMSDAGKVAFGPKVPGVQVGDYAQTRGSLAMSFTLRQLPFEKFRQNDEDIAAVNKLLHESIAGAGCEGGHQIAPYMVHTTPVNAAEDGTLFFATVIPVKEEAGDACSLQATMKKAAEGQSTLASAASALAESAKLKTANGQVSLTDIVAPAASILCSEFACRKSYPLPLPADTRCNGYGCTAVCCEEDWSDKALPLEDVQSVPGDAGGDLDAAKEVIAAAGAAAAAATTSSLETEEPSDSEHFQCWAMHACRVADAEGASNGQAVYKMGDDWSYAGAGTDKAAVSDPRDRLQGTLKDCQSTCIAASSCTGITYEEAGSCILYVGHRCDPNQAEAGNYLTREAGKTTCVKVEAAEEEVEAAAAAPKVEAEPEQERDLSRAAAALPGKPPAWVNGGEKPWSKPVSDALKNIQDKAKEQGAESKPVEEIEDGITASFTIEGVGYSSGMHEALVDSIKRAVAFITLREESDVRVAIKASQVEDTFEGISPAHDVKVHKKLGESTTELQGHDDEDDVDERSTGGMFGPPQRRMAAAAGLEVHLTLVGCGDCSEEKVALSAETSATIIADSVHKTLELTVEVSVSVVTIPAEPTQCADVQCGNYMAVEAGDRSCKGGECVTTCCKPKACAQIKCQGKLHHHILNVGKTCSSAETCQQLCCVVSCAKYTCPDDLCPKADNWHTTASADDVDEKCCEKRKCCDGPIAACAACRECKSTQAYCSQAMSKWHRGARRLMTESMNTSCIQEARRLDDQPPANQAFDKLTKRIQRLKHSAEGRALKQQRNLGPKKAWADKWNQAVTTMQAAHHGAIAGCQSELSVPCNYKLQTVMAAHKGFRCNKVSVNTVQVLSDTSHAVSCGDDAICWVWRIRDGKCTQAFPDHAGPVHTATVLNDATYILSAGATSYEDETQGEAYLWDWRQGIKHKSWSNAHGAFLSSVEFPAYRIFGLGVADNFTSLLNWDVGTYVRLPYNSQTIKEVQNRIKFYMQKYGQTRLNGIERLAAQMAGHSHKFIEDLILAKCPEIKDVEQKGENVYNYFHRNNFGAVNAIAYVPSRLRFMTGHGDGNVRYWSAQTGMLLMVMTGHQGPVRAVVGSPKRQEGYTGGDDGTVRVWCLETGQQKLLLYQPYGGAVLSLAMFPGGDKLAVGSSDGAVRIWNINTGIQLCKIDCGGGAVNGLAVNPSNPLGQVIAAGADGIVRVYNPN